MTDISVHVLKPFPFSRNGIEEEFAAAGETIDIPANLFDGLNNERYVRRAVIGDGHFTLQAEAPVTVPTASIQQVSAPEQPSAAPAPAPQPPAKTTALTDTEEASIADGTWKSLKYFTKRSLAAKVSEDPINSAADADAAIELYIESKKV